MNEESVVLFAASGSYRIHLRKSVMQVVRKVREVESIPVMSAAKKSKNHNIQAWRHYLNTEN